VGADPGGSGRLGLGRAGERLAASYLERPGVRVVARGVPGRRGLANHAGLARGAAAPSVASAIDFILEGLYAQKKISRSEERGYSGAEPAAPRRGARREEPSLDEEIRMPAGKKKYYN